MEEYCRTCFRHNEFKKFDFDAISQISDMRIDEMIIYCLQLEISPYDALPQQICEACLSVLNSTFLFRKQYYHADTKFRKLLKYLPSAQLEPIGSNMELEPELKLLDAIITEPASNETFGQESYEPIDPILYDQPQPPMEIQEIKIEEACIEKEPDQQSVVKKKKIYECKQCERRVSYKASLLRHQQCSNHSGIRVIASEENPNKQPIVVKHYCSKIFECEQCNHKAYFKGNLQRHQQCWNHSGIRIVANKEKPDQKTVVVKKYRSKMYECEECNHRAAFKGNLVRHQACWDHNGIRIVEPNDKTPQKVIKKLQCCEECDFQSFVRANFLRHQKIWKHTKYNTRDIEVDQVVEKCPKCPHCGVLRANLQQHVARWCPVLHGERRKPRRYAKKYSFPSSSNEKGTIEPEAPQIPTSFGKVEIEENIPVAAIGQEPEESSNSIISLQTQEMSISHAVEGKSTIKSAVVKQFTSKIFECEQCGHRAYYKANLLRHHKSRNHVGITVIDATDAAPLKKIKKLLQCEECSYQSFVCVQFARHQSTCKHTKCSSRDVEVEHILQTCPHCGALRANLQQHITYCPKLRQERQKAIKRAKKTKNPRSRVKKAAIGSVAPSVQANNYVKIEAEEIFDTDQ